jgi:hypothetical protein
MDYKNNANVNTLVYIIKVDWEEMGVALLIPVSFF